MSDKEKLELIAKHVDQRLEALHEDEEKGLSHDDRIDWEARVAELDDIRRMM